MSGSAHLGPHLRLSAWHGVLVLGAHLCTHVNKLLYFALAEVTADLGGQQNTGASTQFAVLFVELALQYKLLKVHVGHGNGHRFQAALFRQVPHLPF